MGPNDNSGITGKLGLLIVFSLVFASILCFVPLGVTASTGVRFLHLAPGAGPVEIWIDGQLVKQDLEFRTNTDYVEVTPDQHRIICKTREGPDTVVLNSLFPFRKDKEYTVAVTGGDREDLELIYVIDNCPPTENLSQVTFTNAVPSTSPARLEVKYGPTLYSDLAFRMGGGCRLIPPDKHLFRLTEQGSGELIAEKELNLKPGTRHNIFAIGSEDGQGAEFLVLSKPNKPEETPKIFGIERSVLQLFGAGLIASLVILVIGR